MSTLKQLEEMLSQGKISRREFLARASALGFTAALSPGLLRTTAHAATPKRGGRFRQGLGGGSTTDTLDPALNTDAVEGSIMRQVRNYLGEIDYRGIPFPELAESWESTPDAAKWVFKLRKGVEFHNGKTMDAEDIIFSINHHRGEESKSAAKTLAEPIKDIKADGKHTVVFTLEAGNADFPAVLCNDHFAIAPAGTEGAEWEKGIGTGGYILVSHEPGVRCLTKRNPNYWKEGRAHFDEVEILTISDLTARTNALITGKVDYINRCDVKTLQLLEKEPGIQVIDVTSPTHYSLPMLTDRPPYDDNRVRLALKYAIDREHMVKMILRGYGTVGNDHPIGPTYRFHPTEAELPQRKYDPDKARFHLKKAGMEGHVFKLSAADAAFVGGVDTAVLYEEHAAKAGIKIEVVREPNDGYWSDVWMKRPWCECYWHGRATTDMMFTSAYAEGAAWNDSHWSHDRFNKLLKEARAELDEAKRREMYVEMQRIVRDEGGVVIPMFANLVQAANNKVRYENIAGLSENDNARNAERWWFA